MVKPVGIEGIFEQETTLDFVRLDNGGKKRVYGQRWSLMNDAAVSRRTT